MTVTRDIKEWWVYRGTGSPLKDWVKRLPEAPPWRAPLYKGTPIENTPQVSVEEGTFQADSAMVTAVNTALYLRRPLLVEGKPGTGKSSLARAVAQELGLGEPLIWPISTRTTLADGLYHYDAIGRLQEAARLREKGADGNSAPESSITQFLRLRALGTALAPWRYPRVLLIDEIDKGDVDLPNDLLHVLEERQFEIPELARLADNESVRRGEPYMVRASDGGPVPVGADGWVRCHAFPFIILTSNGEREFPPAFLRRCVRLKMNEPDKDRLTAIVKAHLGDDAARKAGKLIEDFLSRSTQETLATDQLLSAVFLATSGAEKDMAELSKIVLRSLGGTGNP